MSVTVFTRPGCPLGVRAKEQLSAARIAFEELVLNRDYR